MLLFGRVTYEMMAAFWPIDVYQLGAVLCRLMTGEPVLSYIYDATVAARVPASCGRCWNGRWASTRRSGSRIATG